jgi:hypothetical protein
MFSREARTNGSFRYASAIVGRIVARFGGVNRVENSSFIAPIALMATATGARTMTGVAAVARVRSPELAKVLAALALLELIGDKIPGIPNRTDAGPLVGRVVAGAAIGATVAHAADRDRITGAIVGAVFAFIGAHVSFRARRALSHQLPPTAAAAIEDAAILSIARLGARGLPPR